jgi:hypothetical protein
MPADRKLRFSRYWSFLPCPTTSRSAHIADLIDDLTDLHLAQVADLREFAQATEVGEGRTHLEDALRHREIRRADLYRQFELAAFSPPPIPIVAPNALDLPEDN